METSVVGRRAVEEEEEIRSEMGGRANGGGVGRNSVHTLLPSQTIALSSSSSSASTSSAAASTSANVNPLGRIISEAKQFSMEIKKLNEQLALAQQRNEELTAENSTQNTKLVEAAELIAEQQRQLDGRFAFSFGQEAEEEDGGGSGEVNMDDLRELKNLVAQERKQRLETEEKFAKLKTAVKSMNEEYSQFFEEVKEHLVDEGEQSTSKERLDQVSRFMQDRFQKHVEEQLALKTTVVGMNQIIQKLLKVIKSQNLKPVTMTTTTKKPLAKNITLPAPAPKIKVGVKIVPRQPIKVAKVEKSAEPVPLVPPKNTQEIAEHAEDTSKSVQGFFCICGSEYSSKSNLVIHIRTFTVDGKFKCKICHEKFVLFYMLRRHMRSKHNIQPMKGSGAHVVGCMECGQTFSSSANLWKHRKSKHSKAKAPVDDKNSSPAPTPTKQPAPPPPSEDSNDSVQFLEEHFDELPDPPPNLRNQTPVPTTPQPFTSPARFITPKITKVTSEPVSISGKKHGMNIAKRHQGFFCICGIKFISRKSLDGHVQFQNKHHAESPSTSSLEVANFGSEHHRVHPSKPLQCICGFRSASKYNTSKHVMYYTTERKFKCDLCPKRLLNMGYLREHYARSHKLSRNIALGHGCRKCGTSFESMKEFHEHSRIVHGVGLVKAENGTPQASTSSTSISTPVITKFKRTSLPATRPGKGPTITGVRGSLGVTTPKKLSSTANSSPATVEEKFGCVICGGAFTRIYDLHRHLRNIHEADPTNFPIGCPDCDSTFRTRQSFICHRVSVHNSTIQRKRQLKTEAPSASSSGSSVPIPIFNLDDDYDDEDMYESTPLSPEPIPIAYDFENEGDEYDDDEMSVMPKLEPTASVPYPSAAVEVQYEEDEEEEDDDEELSPTDTMVDVHEQDVTKRAKGFHCTCGVTFISKKNFRTHIKQKTQKWNFKCKICQKRFFYNSYLTAHMLKSHKIEVAGSKDGNIGCVYCGSTFETFYDLRQHQKAEHNEKAENNGTPTQQANVTPIASTSKGSRQPAKRTTTTTAATTTTIRNEPHGYDTEKQELGLFYCICGKNCNNKKSLQAHITYNKRDRKFPCNICGSRFPFQSFLSQHLERSHKMKRGHVAKPRSTYGRVKRQSNCAKCGKSFKTQVELFRHNKLYHKMPNLIDRADKLQTREAALSRIRNQQKTVNRNSPHHQVSSSSSDKYTCACGYKYAQKSSLLKHIAKQSRGKIFKCPECSKGFMEAASLRLHSESVHNIDMQGKHHGCGICGELFESMIDRIKHRIQVHHVRR